MNSILRIAVVAGAACLLMAALPVRADDQRAEGAAVLSRAQQLEDLRVEGAAPFILRAQKNVIERKQQIAGTYSLTWAAANRWREEELLGDFSRVRDGAMGGYLQVRAWNYQPQVIFDLDQILDVAAMAHLSPGEDAGKVRSRKIGGAVLSCVEIWRKKSRQREVCVDPTTGLVVHAELSYTADPWPRHPPTVDYAGTIALGDRRFPSRMEFRRPDGFSVEVSVGSLEGFSGTADSLPVADPAGSEFWGDCRYGTPGEAIQKVVPIYPAESQVRHDQGLVILYVRIETDGKVSRLKPLRSPSPALAETTLEAVAQWKYKPRTCGGTPVKEETVLTVFFQAW